MRFQRQLVVGIATQISLVLLVATLAASTLLGVSSDTLRETRRGVANAIAADRVQINADALVAEVRGYLLTGAAAYLERAGEYRRLLEGSLRLLETGAPDDVLVAAVAREAAAYAHAIDAAAGEREYVRDLPALEALYEKRLAPQRQRLDAALANLQHARRGQFAALASDEQRRARATSIAVVVGAILAALLSLAIGIRTGRRLASQYRAIQEAKAEAAEAARMRKELLDTVSHDLRAPLTTIMLALEAADGDGSSHAAAIENAAKRMNRLVEDLLDAARAESHVFELALREATTDELLRSTFEIFAARAERAGVDLRIETGEHAMVTVDPDRVLRILGNLVGNALKVTPAGGAIVLAVHPTAKGVRFTVHDTGPGIPEEQQPEIFDAYRQGPRARRGSLGLGLHISRTLAKAHGGTIGVDSRPDQGSTFWVDLPRHP